jgi:Ca-activated chloride channel family protein
MQKRLYRPVLLALAAIVAAFFTLPARAQEAAKITEGTLQVARPDGTALGVAPLKHTDVKADISGYLARVTVRQEFENPFTEKIEAVYVFPLSQNAAVDDMTMQVGARAAIKGKILRREEAKEVYETAKQRGQVASLLDQERPNIFTQSVANILPGEKVTITISYVETLKYEDGTYTFAFPMVVGPRYIPGNPTGKQNPGGRLPDTDRVPDASRITPPVAAKGMRAGHDVSLQVNLDAGVPLDGVACNSHAIDVNQTDAGRAAIKLKNENEIPNKDFVLKYDVAGRKVADALLTHRDPRGGFFTFILQPPDRVEAKDVNPKEIVFVLDTSGSMSGFPIEKAKESMKLALDNLYPSDTFNLITFAGDTHILFDKPVPATKENLAKAQAFLASRAGGGGTEMMKAIRAALDPSDAAGHVRIVCFMTDGYVGNEGEIISEINKHPNARVFSFGIGSSVNRFLLDKMAEEGRGEVEYVSLQDDGSAAAKRFHERIRNPLLTDVSIDWNGLPVADVYPQRLPDLFSAKPVTLTGRYTGSGAGVIRLKGMMAGRQVIRDIPVTLPDVKPEHDVLATLWARARVDDLTRQDYAGVQNGTARPEIKETITQLGLEYRLLTQFTSFVAVEELVVTDGGTPRRVDVPVEAPEGVNRDTTVGETDEEVVRMSPRAAPLAVFSVGGVFKRKAPTKPAATPAPQRAARNAPPDVRGAKVGNANSVPTNKKPDFAVDGKDVDDVTTENGPAPISGGVVNGKATSLPKPSYPVLAKSANASGTVQVRVVIDETGKVVAAQAVAGHPLLRAEAVKAAQAATFAPTLMSGKPVRTVGVINYNFAGDASTAAAAQKAEPPPALTPEQQKQLAVRAKLAPALWAVVEQLNAGQPLSPDAKFVRDGQAEVRVSFADKTPEALAKLKALGFEVMLDPQTAKVVIGRIALDKLWLLAELDEVRFVAPQTN